MVMLARVIQIAKQLKDDYSAEDWQYSESPLTGRDIWGQCLKHAWKEAKIEKAIGRDIKPDEVIVRGSIIHHARLSVRCRFVVWNALHGRLKEDLFAKGNVISCNGFLVIRGLLLAA